MKRNIPILLLATALVGTSLLGTPREVCGQESEADLLATLSDPDAPIFKYARFGVVGDLFEVVPAVTAAVRKLNSKWVTTLIFL